jgi:hypothetical protein
LGYELELPPAGFATKDEHWRDVGVPDEERGLGDDRIIDPGGAARRIWFQVVPEPETVKNDLQVGPLLLGLHAHVQPAPLPPRVCPDVPACGG